MIAVIEEEVVKKRKWIDSEEFMDAVTIAQSSPGLLAVNISIFLGYKLKGTKGSIVATLGSITPPFLIILAVALFFTHFQDNEAVIKIFKGIRPAVVALIAIPVINMAKKAKLSKIRLAMAIVTAILIIFARVSPVYIMLAVFVYYFYTIGADIIHHHNKKGGER